MTTAFVDRMTIHAEIRLGMTVSALLRTGWEQLETACKTSAIGDSAWQVLQLPTGTGKTQALAVLCASQPLDGHPGILIVTKCRSEADKLARTINALSGSATALALHQNSPAPISRVHGSPVLIVTHSAYRNSLREIASGGVHKVKWDRIRHYHHGERKWLIVDEAFDWVESFQGDLTQLSALNGALASITHPELKSSLSDLAELTHSIVDGFEADAGDKLFNEYQAELMQGLDIASMISLVSNTMPSDLDFWPSIEKPRGAVRKEYLNALEDLRALQGAQNIWVCRRGKRIKLNGSRLLMDAVGMHGVILDATAAIDATYDLLGSRVALLPRPLGSRSYGNVTLNVSVGHRVGKEHMSANARRYWPDVRSALNRQLEHDSSTLVVCHKDVKEDLSLKGLNGCSASAHWGDLDGKNDWCDFDVGVIFGLPFLDDIAPTNAVFACQPQLAQTWFTGGRQFGQHADMGQAFKDGFVAKSVVQALNRIRCRKAVDGLGNCLPTELFLLQAKCRTGSVLLSHIQSQMPGIRVQQWDAGLAPKRHGLTPAQAKLLTLMASAATGTHKKSWVIEGLGISERTFDRLSRTMQQTNSPLMQELISIGVQYHCVTGRGKEAYFMKS